MKNHPQTAEVGFLKTELQKASFRLLNFDVCSVRFLENRYPTVFYRVPYTPKFCIKLTYSENYWPLLIFCCSLHHLEYFACPCPIIINLNLSATAKDIPGIII